MVELRSRPGHSDPPPHALDVYDDAPHRSRDPRRRVVATFTVVMIIVLIVLAAVLTWTDAGSSAGALEPPEAFATQTDGTKRPLPAAASSFFRGRHLRINPVALVAGVSTNLTVDGVPAGAHLQLAMQPPCPSAGCRAVNWLAAAPSSNVSVQLQEGAYALLLGEQRRAEGDSAGAEGGGEAADEHEGGAGPAPRMTETGVRLTAAQPMPLAPKQVSGGEWTAEASQATLSPCTCPREIIWPRGCTSPILPPDPRARKPAVQPRRPCRPRPCCRSKPAASSHFGRSISPSRNFSPRRRR